MIPIYHLETILLGWYDYTNGHYRYRSVTMPSIFVGDDYDGVYIHLLKLYERKKNNG